MIYKIDIKKIVDDNMHVTGWVLPNDINEKVIFEVYDDKNKLLDNFKLVSLKRQDVETIYLKKEVEGLKLGFDLTFPYQGNDVYFLVIKTPERTVRLKLDRNEEHKFNSFRHKKKEALLSYFTKETLKRAFEYLKREGIFNFIKKSKRKIGGIYVDYDYNEWYTLTKVTEDEIKRQNETSNQFKILPFFSIVIPIYNTPKHFLKLLLLSILNQTYKNYEVCILDATDYKDDIIKDKPKEFFNDFEKLYNREYRDIYKKEFNEIFKIKYDDKNLSIAYNTNAAIDMASGDYIVLSDHDDELTLDALYENAKVINQNIDVELIYSDEDKVDTKNNTYSEPHFKSDFNLDMLLSVNYFCHLTVIKKGLLDKLKNIDNEYERNEYNGAQDYDLFLRLVNIIIDECGDDYNALINKKIHHIRKVLYHWRCYPGSTSQNPESKTYAFENGKKAIADFYKRTHIKFPKVVSVEEGFDKGIYHTIFEVEDRPLVSIIIPNKDHIEDLDLAISSVNKGNYKNIEFIIVENNSTEKKTFLYYEEMLKVYKNTTVIKYEGKFNYSKINNFAVPYARGEYLLFLNNDVEMINPNAINELLSYIVRPDVGAVGAKLLYKDKTIQHAGVILGFGGIAGHTFIGILDNDHSYMNRSQTTQDLNAVTAACLMTKKSLFIEVGGFTEILEVAFNDIDLCMKIREKNKLVVYNPYASFFHYESKTRGLEDTEEKVKRFNKEVAIFASRYQDKLSSGDEYYNPNLTLRKSDFSLRNLQYEKIGEPYPLPKEIKDLMK